MSEMPSKSQLEAALTQVEFKLSKGLLMTYASYGILLLLITWLNFHNGQGNVKIWLVKIIPLLLVAHGIWMKKSRSFSWLCFIVLPYFVFITPTLFEKFAALNWLYMVLTIILFIAAMMTSRWLQQRAHLVWQLSQTPS